jgi:hypothetical protein
MTELFGSALYPGTTDLAGLVVRLAINLVFALIVVRAVYYRLYPHRDYIFTYVLLNVVTFSLAFLLSRVPIELGFALGLFAVFGILRYRTEAIQVRNLTYLFVVIGIALLNALANEQVTWAELLIVNVVIAGTVWVLEAAAFSSREESRRVLYDRLELIGPESSAELLNDLRSRTRLPIARYEIGDVDLLRDVVDITVFYQPERPGTVHAPAAPAPEPSTRPARLGSS